MAIYTKFADDAPRPQWASQVSVLQRHPRAKHLNDFSYTEVSGIVVPQRSVGARPSHSGGTSLGFPDLTESMHLDGPISEEWAAFEKKVHGAALGLMGLKTARKSSEYHQSDAPEAGLYLSLRSRRATCDTSPSLSGYVQRMFAIRDRSGSQVRMEPHPSNSWFDLDAGGHHFSRNLESL